MTTGRINQVAALGFPRFNRKVKYITSQSKHEHCSNPPESSRSTDFRGFCLEPRATQTNTTNMCFRSRAANPRGPPVGPLGKSPSVPKAYLKYSRKYQELSGKRAVARSYARRQNCFRPACVVFAQCCAYDFASRIRTSLLSSPPSSLMQL